MEPTIKEVTEAAQIFIYGRQITLVYSVAILVYTIATLRSTASMWLWYRANSWRAALALVLSWLVSAGIVIVPNFAQILGNLGFNADQGTASIGAIIALLVIRGKDESEPLKIQATVTEKPVDPIPNEPEHFADKKEKN